MGDKFTTDLANVINNFSHSGFVQENRKLRLENIELQKKISRLESEILRLKSRQVGRKKTITKGIEKKAMNYYSRGMSYREIGKRLNISHTSVENIVRRKGDEK